MSKFITFLLIFFFFISCKQEKTIPENVVISDIDNFWEAYDKITSTEDSVLQYEYLDNLFLQKGTPGLKALREVRNYSAESYINAINSYPKFWNSVRENTLTANKFSGDLDKGIEKLRRIYPSLRPAKIYFSMGALRANGVTLDSLVLIGAELAMTDKNTDSSEFPEEIRSNRRIFFDSNPIEDLVLLNVHEYVHTQQKNAVNNLLSYTIREGVAEFVSVKAMGMPSAVPAIEFGKQNAEKIRAKFEHEMFYINNRGKWLWSDVKNDFGVRDLGYYVGYQMSENYYNKAENKMEAIKELIELDFEEEEEIEKFVKKTEYFSAPLDELYQRFEENRPTVSGIKQFKNGDQNVSTAVKEITIEFSKPLNGHNTGVDFGDLGKEAFPKNDVTKRFWTKDNKAWTITVELEPNKRYQMLITNNFRTADGIPLKGYLVDFKTAK